MKKLLFAIILLLIPVSASAQCNGIFPNNTICGNITGGSNLPRPVPNSALTGVPGGTNGQIQYNNSGNFGGFTMSGDCTINTTTGAITCTRITNPFVFSPLDYGAVCDGATHDEIGFQNALNAAIAAGGVLQLPVGNCVLNANIINAGTFISTIIKGYGLTSQITFLGNFGFSFPATASYYVLQDFSVNCQSTSVNACVSITNASQSTVDGSVIQRVRINQHGAIGFQFQNMVETNFLNNVILSTGASGFTGLYIDNTQTADVGANIIQGNTIIVVSGATTYGTYMLNVGGSQTKDNNIGGYSYDIYSDNNLASGAATGILVQGNQLDNYIVAGIYFNSAGLGGAIGHVSVNNNTLHAVQSGSGSLGIAFAEAPGSVTWSFNNTIAANIIDTYSGTAGILLAGAQTSAITGNSIHDEGTPTNAGIITNASSSDCVVVGNVVSNYSTHLTNGASCTATGNN